MKIGESISLSQGSIFTLVELDLIEGVQNLVFGIIKPIMLTGMKLEEFRAMMEKIGRQMGRYFDKNAIKYIFLLRRSLVTVATGLQLQTRNV